MNPPFRFDEFRDVAERLAQTESEAYYRCAVSRLYYSLYHLAKDLIGIKNPDANSTWHETVLHHLTPFDKLATKDLRELRDLRVDADYSPTGELMIAKPDWGENWRRAAFLGQKVCEKLEKLRARKRQK